MNHSDPLQTTPEPPVWTAHREERLIARGLCLCVIVGLLARYLGRWHWVFELTTHFIEQACILAGIVTLLLLVRRHWKLAAITGALTLGTAAEWFTYTRAETPSGVWVREPSDCLVVVSTNVYSKNRNAEALSQWLQESEADVVFLCEVDPWWAARIESWKSDWPHQIVHPRPDNFGLALISRYPLSDSHVFDLDGPIPAVDCRVQAPSGEWTVVGLHPFPPVGRAYSQLRNQQLLTAAARINTLAKPCVVVGDLNCSPASPMFQDFVTATGLIDSSRRSGWQPTWPAGNRLLRIPIDHCLCDPQVGIVERSVGPDVGSDHLPIRAKLFRMPESKP